MSTERFQLEKPVIPKEVEAQLDQLNAESKYRWLKLSAEETKASLDAVREKVKDIEGFWAWAITSHASLKAFTTSSSDQHALSFISNVELLHDAVDPRQYELVFHFKENPYFTNTTLSKKYTLAEGVPPIGPDGKVTKETFDDPEEQLVSKSSEIQWKSEENNLLAKQPRQTIQNGDDEDGFEGDQGSFFYYFVNDDEDSFSISTLLKDDVLQNVYEYFTGEAEDAYEDDEDEDEDDELDEEDDDDEGSVDLEDEDDQPKKKKQRV